MSAARPAGGEALAAPRLHLRADGWFDGARLVPSPNHDARPAGAAIDLVVVHNISLPPGRFGGEGVEQLFTNRLDPAADPYYPAIAAMRVSAHLFVRRTGEVVQFVALGDRAWHAGASRWCGRERCNDFSVGIELEGADDVPFEPVQYERLATLVAAIRAAHPVRAIVGHSDVAPGRKTDPGPHFDWTRLAVTLG